MPKATKKEFLQVDDNGRVSIGKCFAGKIFQIEESLPLVTNF